MEVCVDRSFCSSSALLKLLPAFPLVDGGVAKRSPVSGIDVAEAIVKCVFDGNTAANTVELVGPKEYTIEQAYAAALAALVSVLNMNNVL